MRHLCSLSPVQPNDLQPQDISPRHEKMGTTQQILQMSDPPSVVKYGRRNKWIGGRGRVPFNLFLKLMFMIFE